MPPQEIHTKPYMRPANYHSQENVTNDNGVQQISLQKAQGHVVQENCSPYRDLH